MVGKAVNTEIIENISDPDEIVTLEVTEHECYITESKPNNLTNLALPEEVRNGLRIINSQVDKESSTAYFIKPNVDQYYAG